MIDPDALKKWIERRKKRLSDQQGKHGVTLPNGIQIHIHMPSNEKLPMTPDGKALATRDSVARYPG
jgi:hypothetical protein